MLNVIRTSRANDRESCGTLIGQSRSRCSLLLTTKWPWGHRHGVNFTGQRFQRLDRTRLIVNLRNGRPAEEEASCKLASPAETQR